jgi:hypothetical protein
MSREQEEINKRWKEKKVKAATIGFYHQDCQTSVSTEKFPHIKLEQVSPVIYLDRKPDRMDYSLIWNVSADKPSEVDDYLTYVKKHNDTKKLTVLEKSGNQALILLRFMSPNSSYERVLDSGAITTASGENNLAYTPKQAFTSWATYRLPQGFTIGGGARYVSSLLRGTDGAVGTPKYANSYWVVDSMLGYVVNKNVDLQLNLYNIFNKDYVAAINKSGYRYTPGTPRAVALTANFKF